MRIVCKYSMVFGYNNITLPLESEIIHVGEQYGQLHIWVEQDPTRPFVQREFNVYATGQYIYNNNEMHVSTVMVGDFVWHLYENIFI